MPAPMTEEDKRQFMAGMNTPEDQLMDGGVDQLLKGYKKRWNNPMRVQIIPTSDAYRDNYERIRWER